MCLLIIGYQAHPDYPLIVAANRDEYYARPAAGADFWPEYPDLLAGRDLQGGGTWLGITRQGRFAALTNIRDPGPHLSDRPSRGALVLEFLTGGDEPPQYVEKVLARGAEFNGFNLLCGNRDRMYWVSNRAEHPVAFKPGVYGVSNGLLNTPWPKVIRATQAMGEVIAQGKPGSAALFSLLRDETPCEDADLPDTGVGLELERLLAPIFICTDTYGTRNSTVVMLDKQGRMDFEERIWNADQPAVSARYWFKL